MDSSSQSPLKQAIAEWHQRYVEPLEELLVSAEYGSKNQVLGRTSEDLKKEQLAFNERIPYSRKLYMEAAPEDISRILMRDTMSRGVAFRMVNPAILRRCLDAEEAWHQIYQKLTERIGPSKG